MSNIGKRLRKIRNEQKLTAKKLSELSGVPEKTIYRIETGEVTDPRLSSLEPLVEALNCSADEILFDSDKFTSLGALRQAFANTSKLNEYQMNTILEVVQKMNLAYSFERMVSSGMNNNEGK